MYINSILILFVKKMSIFKNYKKIFLLFKELNGPLIELIEEMEKGNMLKENLEIKMSFMKRPSKVLNPIRMR